MTKKLFWILFAVMAIAIGLYPLIYFFVDGKFGLLNSKDDQLLNNIFWRISFYDHITLGGLAMLTGWTQFSSKLRARNLSLHRWMGKVYVIAALASALGGFYIAMYATGGLITMVGFSCLGILWFYTTLSAYLHVRKGNIDDHEKMMIYSYSLCFAAVTLRVWLPLLTSTLHDFMLAYRIVAWLCWVPNLLFAFLWVSRMKVKQ